jgi:OLD-like protein
VADARAVVLVEGRSDQAALAVLAARQGRDLDAAGVRIVPMGGATNIGHYLAVLGHAGGIELAGLCDAAEAPGFRRGLERAGLGTSLERRGFYVCQADLEDELIRALGVAGTERVIEDRGELRSLRIFCNQPAQRGRPDVPRLRRFVGTRSGRKLLYARALAGAVDLGQVPEPLDRVLARVGAPRR